MTVETNQLTLSTWWEEISFNGKELYRLNNSEIVLEPLQNSKARVIATITSENADTVLKALRDKFHEVEAKIKELETEWITTEDKLKLTGKVERMKDYLLHVNALGNIDRLLQLTADWSETITSLTEDNYNTKLKLVQQAEDLLQTNNYKEATQTLRALTEQWKKTGYLDKKRNDELWARLEEARNKIFERKRNSQEEHEKDMMQNLDMKMELAEKAEVLAQSEDWKKTSELFRQLMEQWKSIGRTMNDKNEELWNRFINAKNVFYDRKRVHFESIQKEQETNYSIKLALVEKAEELKDSTNWASTAQAFSDLMEEWKNIGRVPIEKADELWNRLIAAKEHFFNAKKQNQESFRLSLEDNYAQKMALLKRAEALKDSTHWHEATDELNELLAEWKKIGPIPRAHNVDIWDNFLAARKYFFERKDANRERRKQHAEKQFSRKLNQSQLFLQKLEEELKDEQDKLEDFKNGIQNITPGHKEVELRAHLEKLIERTEAGIKKKEEKIESVKKQLSELETGKQDNHPKDKNIEQGAEE